MTDLALALSLIAAISLGAQWLAWRLKLPAILFLLAAGLLLGPGTGVLNPDLLLGEVLFPMVSIAVAIILFEGALTLRFNEIRGLVKVVRNLVTIGMLITFAVLAFACHWLLGVSLQVSLLFGAVMVVTGPTVVAPLLRTIRPRAELDRVLRWEGIIIDPLGAIFAVLMFELVIIQASQEAAVHSLWILIKTMMLGGALGLGAGVAVATALKKGWLPLYLRKIGVLAAVLLAYALSEQLQHESGLLTVTVMGMYMANKSELDIDDIMEFKEDLSVILISALFILLAARVDVGNLVDLGLPLVILLLVVQLVARPLCVLASAYTKKLSWRDKAFLSWIAPRGIVAAAVSSLFALRLQQAGIEDADKLVSLSFAVIIATVVLQSLTAGPVARLLGVVREAPRGVLIIGANSLARAVAQSLRKAEIQVLLADPVWENYRLARMEGLEVYYGNPQSEQAEAVLDLSSIRQVYALSPNRHQNANAITHFAYLFGDKKVFSIRSSQGKGFANQESATFRARQILFSEDCTFAKLNSLLMQGWQVKSTKLKEAFDWDAYKERQKDALPLFIIDKKGFLSPVSNGDQKPEVDEVIIALLPPQEKESQNAA
ncbi:cation:proton antiporter [Gallaecimonas xiamenensis]|uniref:Sodium/hydrogen exchanger family protein n=1 Tax=Gallaecimonas xiamenensis 3-C-1 TaxID=745411 RepID=K2IBV0_9GAMM|nr:sodium:proton antiporter [Gallaecimonas xiamenensis]EKE67391.1 sodium/hydrogen exchanger family protein [Gallaecimonas xiamenensis 3-C-1]